MARIFNHRVSPALFVAVLGVLGALGGGALAAASFVSSNGQIYGCVSSTGELTVLKSGGHCKHGQSQLSWNQRGSRGATGSKGATGKVDTSNFYTKGQDDSRFVPSAGLKRVDWSHSCVADSSNSFSCQVGPNDVLSLGGLILHAQCSATSNATELKLTSSGGANAETNVGYTSGTSAQQSGYGGSSGTVFDITTGTGEGPVGTIVYRDPDANTTVTLSFFAFAHFASAFGDGYAGCELYGNAVETTGG